MKQSNQIENPFIKFGTPKQLVVNGIKEPSSEITECLELLHKNINEVIAFTFCLINGTVKLYVATI